MNKIKFEAIVQDSDTRNKGRIYPTDMNLNNKFKPMLNKLYYAMFILKQ